MRNTFGQDRAQVWEAYNNSCHLGCLFAIIAPIAQQPDRHSTAHTRTHIHTPIHFPRGTAPSIPVLTVKSVLAVLHTIAGNRCAAPPDPKQEPEFLNWGLGGRPQEAVAQQVQLGRAIDEPGLGRQAANKKYLSPGCRAEFACSKPWPHKWPSMPRRTARQDLRARSLLILNHLRPLSRIPI